MKTFSHSHCPHALSLFLLVLVALPAFAADRNSPSQRSSPSGLPVPQSSAVPRPRGAVGGLKVLDWAGFKAAVTYTFDDGLPSQLANYPQLHATGVRMTFFLNSNAGEPAAWAQVAKDGHELGNHTAHHCNSKGAWCGTFAGTLEAEYDLCTDYLEQIYGVPDVWTTASPYGDSGYDQVARTRFFLNRDTWDGQVAPNGNTNPHSLPIYGVPKGASASAINAQVDSARSAGNWLILLLHSLGGDGGYGPVDASEVIDSINHARSAADIWIDSMVNVGAYWAGQKTLANATTTQSGNDTVLHWTLPPHFPRGKYVRVTVTGGTLKQGGRKLPWNDAGFYEVALDPGTLTISH